MGKHGDDTCRGDMITDLNSFLQERRRAVVEDLGMTPGAGPLFELFQSARYDEALALLRTRPELVNAVDADGWTALFFFVMADDRRAIDILVELGADVNHVDYEGWTALMEAARSGLLEAVDALIQHQADINAANPLGWTALHQALLNHRWDVAKLLLLAGADRNAESCSHVRPWHYANLRGIDPELATMLRAD